jgi:hypothetical protein
VTSAGQIGRSFQGFDHLYPSNQKAGQKDLLEAKDLDELKRVFKRWRRIGWKNVCKLWLEERTPEQLKGEGG